MTEAEKSYTVVMEPAEPGQTGPGTMNPKQSWHASWASKVKPGGRGATPSFALRRDAERVAAKRVAEGYEEVRLVMRWSAGWL